MARENFEAVMEVIFRHEGGFVNHPRDPGGATNRGITKRTLEEWLGHSVTVADVQGLPKATARAIYKERYWKLVRGDELPAGLDLVAMDGAVNSGPSRGVRWLQKAVGVEQDGQLGPVTLAAVQKADKGAIDRAIAARMAFLRGLKTWGTFGKGWSRRLTETQAEAHRMFGKVYTPDPAEQPAPWSAAALNALAALFAKWGQK